MKPLNLEANAPWKQRFRITKVSWAQVARTNPARGLACSSKTGVFQLYGWNTSTGELTQITQGEKGRVFGSLSPDGRYLYYLDDADGNEVGHFVRAPTDGSRTPQDLTPDLAPYSSWQINESQDGRVLGFVAASAEGFQLYIIEKGADDSLGQPRALWKSTALSFGPTFSYGGEIAIVTTTERTGKNEYSLIALHTATGEKVSELYDPEGSIDPGRFAPISGDLRLLATTDKSGYSRPLIWNPRTGERTDIPLPSLEGTVDAWDWSPDGKCILLCQLNRAHYQLYTYELDSAKLHKLNHPAGTVGGFFGGQWVSDGEICLTIENATTPPAYVALDAHSGEVRRTMLTSDTVPPGCPWRSVSFKSTGGAEIQAWLAVPDGQGPFPTILHTHGGPTSVMTELFAPGAQAWLDHGFAWLSVNYRGSTTFGKDFERAIWGNLGHAEVDDMAAARDWLVSNGIADPDAILLTGGSYGGYLTLQALGKRPGLWAGGMAMVAIADWMLMYEDQAPTLRGYQVALFGGTAEHKAEAYKASSPITYAGNVKAPVLVIQGSNDTRCPARQMHVYEETLKSLGKDIQVHWFDAGHGSYENEKSVEHQELMLRFAYRVLG